MGLWLCYNVALRPWLCAALICRVISVLLGSPPELWGCQRGSAPAAGAASVCAAPCRDLERSHSAAAVPDRGTYVHLRAVQPSWLCSFVLPAKDLVCFS